MCPLPPQAGTMYFSFMGLLPVLNGYLPLGTSHVELSCGSFQGHIGEQWAFKDQTPLNLSSQVHLDNTFAFMSLELPSPRHCKICLGSRQTSHLTTSFKPSAPMLRIQEPKQRWLPRKTTMLCSCASHCSGLSRRARHSNSLSLINHCTPSNLVSAQDKLRIYNTPLWIDMQHASAKFILSASSSGCRRSHSVRELWEANKLFLPHWWHHNHFIHLRASTWLKHQAFEAKKKSLLTWLRSQSSYRFSVPDWITFVRVL